MKKIQNVCKMSWQEIALGLCATLLGILCAGCDGASPTGTVSGDAGDALPVPVTTDTGTGAKCAVPSPTGDAVSPYGIGRDTPYFLQTSSSPSAERTACESFKSSTPTVRRSDGTYVSTGGIDCSDVANDFRGTTGMPWCVMLTTTNSAGSRCDGSPGEPPCPFLGLAPMSSVTTKKGQVEVRSWGICTPSGTFAGWGCTQS